MIPYYSLAFGKLTLEKPFYLARIAKNTQLVMPYFRFLSSAVTRVTASETTALYHAKSVE